MKILCFLLVCITVIGCGKKAPTVEGEKPSYANVDNPTTRYVESLQGDLHKARRAADAMDQKVAEQQENLRKFNEAYADKPNE